MILPTKHLRPERALLVVGAKVLALLDEPKTVSRLWADMRPNDNAHSEARRVPYDWFVLALDLLYSVGAVEFKRGRLRRLER
jgi:hypothetical protein